MSSIVLNNDNCVEWPVDTGNIPDAEMFEKTTRKLVVGKNNVSYEVLNYVKKEDVNLTPTLFDKCRSVVCDPETKQILSFAPFQSTNYEQFKEKYPDTSMLYITEIIEGTMINLFYDHRIEKWEISTKSGVGGNYWYYRTEYANPEIGNYNNIPSQNTFRQMFLDSLKWDKYGNLSPSNELDDVEILNNFPKHCCYTFVLQHPDNHIVQSHLYPQLYLVAVYSICNRSLDGEACKYIDGKWQDDNLPFVQMVLPDEYKTWDCFELNTNSTIIKLPPKINFASYADISADLNILTNDKYDPKLGYMLLDINTGERAHIENPAYAELKQLRGNNPNLQFHYFSLLRAGKIDDFLRYFPMYINQFNEFEKQYSTFVKRVHQSYLAYYVDKNERKLAEERGIKIAKRYFIHAYKLHHNIYLPSLKTWKDKDGNIIGQKKKITHAVVKEYFEAMTPQSLLYFMSIP